MDHYASLDVSRKATDKEIRLAYLRRAVETHPDKSAKTSDDDEFKAVHEAWDVLQHRRATYDRDLLAAEEDTARQTTAHASRRRQQADEAVAAELRRRAAEMASELEKAQAVRRATATSDMPYYITSTGGGSCYHLTPTCSGLRQAGVMRVSSTGGRRLCATCAKINDKPLIRAPSAPTTSAMSPAPRIYYTTRTGKKYHTDRCCNGLRKATMIMEATNQPALEACSIW